MTFVYAGITDGAWVLLWMYIWLLSTIGALVVGVELHGMVYVLFVLDLLVAALVLLTFGRRDQRPGRRRASPARR